MKYLPKVLIVDDEVDQVNLLSALLRQNGFDVYSLLNPEEIVPVIKTFKPDVIVLDVRIGKHDGKEICKQIKAAEEGKAITVILHSAFPEFGNEYQQCGADEFILKPVNIAHLISRLKHHLL